MHSKLIERTTGIIIEYKVREILNFDQLVRKIMEFVNWNPEILWIETTDHGTGGFSLIEESIQKSYVK
ncbi:hypothetical protein [Flavobacterium sp. N2038]|uniref:hypothetical protein n=1 Tax=Flavobacterium sp. N2038 TaxID=2986829 RepID=UPI0022251D5B|nr:hypothetical protein [Flavobacterium sp. N2038]